MWHPGDMDALDADEHSELIKAAAHHERQIEKANKEAKRP